MATKHVGPIQPSTHNSAVDQFRPDDGAELSTVAPRDIVTGGADKAPKLTPMQKMATNRLVGAVMEGTESAGGDEQQVMAAGIEALQLAKQSLDPLVDANKHSLIGRNPEFELSRGFEEYAWHKSLEVDLKKDATFLAQSAAAFMEFTLLPETWRTLTAPEFAPDATFDYDAVRDKVEVGLLNEDRQYLREAVSQADLDHRLNRIRDKQMNMQLISAHGGTQALAASLLGGVADPAGWVLGLGVGKVAQLGGVGARVAMAEGQVGRAIAYGSLEGTAGNVLYTAALDAAGAHTTPADYAYSAAFGAGFGVMSGVGAGKRPEPHDTAVQAALRDVEDAAVQTNFRLYREAQNRAGADATPDQIANAADEIMLEQARRVREIATAPVPEGQRLYPSFGPSDVDPTTGQIKTVLEAVGARADEAADLQARWGITEAMVPDAAQRAMYTAGAYRVEQWAAANQIDPERLNTIMAKAPWLASSGIQLARSQSDVLKWVAGNLVELTTGSVGKRTAAIDKAMLERRYIAHLTDYEDAYKAWRNGQDSHPVVAAARDILGSEQRQRFDAAVATERRMRAAGEAGTSSNPHVLKAAKALDDGYELMRRDQIDVGTIGSSRLTNLSGHGYAPQRINPTWVLNASNAQRQALVGALARQLEAQWSDFTDGVRFARETAARYVDRARMSAYGAVGVPANLTSTEGAEILRDVLRSMAVPAEDVNKLLGRFSRGGAGHTKARLDLDLNERLELDNGQSFTIADAFIQDQALLFNQYARRTSGEVALTKYGIMGEQGLKQLRELATFGPDGKRATPAELEMFDQVAAEFMGRPVGKAGGNRYLDMLRLLTASSRLGGMGFTQFAEAANGVGALGVHAVLKQIASIPKHIADIRAGRASPLLESIELVGGPLGQEYKVIFPYQEAGDIRVYGRDSIGAIDRIVRAGANAVPWLSGWHHLHSAQMRGMSEQIVHKMLRYIRDGKEDAALRSMGVTPEFSAAVRKELANIAEFDSTGSLVKLDVTKANDAAAMAELVQIVHRGAKQIIQGNFIGETGKWAHNDLLRLLTQFRTFSITAMEKQWTRQRVDYGTAKAFGLLMGSMSFALPIHFARVQFNAAGREDRKEYLEQQLSLDMMVRATLNYASQAGLLGDILDAGAALAGYEMSGVRTGGKSFTENVPGLGYINSTARAIQEKDPRDMIRALPGGNLPWLMPLFNTAD